MIATMMLCWSVFLTAAEPPLLETRPATPLGTTALSANGKVQPRGEPATTWFEYGPTTAYGQKTPEKALPPRLTAYYRETWDHGPAGWQGGLGSEKKALEWIGGGGKSGGFVRFYEPSGFDPNHVDGIGGLHLCKYFYPSTHPSPTGFQGYLGGGDPDLRDARVTLSVRGNNFVANGSELVWWTQSDNDIKLQLTPNWRRANWAYTGFRLTDALKSGTWETVSYRLANDTHAWTFGGHNAAQKRPNYTYAPIDQSQGHVNCDFFHLLAFVDAHKPPTGTIDFDEFELAYRNGSRVYPGNGGKLVAAPKGDDPAALTDGWRHGPGKQWKSVAKPSGPLEFELAFEKPITVKVVQVHQNPEWPAKDVAVLASTDGKEWKPLLVKTLPEKSAGGPNMLFVFARGLSALASRIKVQVHNGYKKEHWGLGEIEIFGDGAPLPTDDDWYHVNADMTGFKAGQTIHYRLMVRTASGVTAGPDASFTIPADARPHVLTGPAHRLTRASATLEGRLAPLGKATKFYFEYGTDDKYSQKTKEMYGGLLDGPRLVFAEVKELAPGTRYHYRLVGVNEAGTTKGEGRVFMTAK